MPRDFIKIINIFERIGREFEYHRLNLALSFNIPDDQARGGKKKRDVLKSTTLASPATAAQINLFKIYKL